MSDPDVLSKEITHKNYIIKGFPMLKQKSPKELLQGTAGKTLPFIFRRRQ